MEEKNFTYQSPTGSIPVEKLSTFGIPTGLKNKVKKKFMKFRKKNIQLWLNKFILYKGKKILQMVGF